MKLAIIILCLIATPALAYSPPPNCTTSGYGLNYATATNSYGCVSFSAGSGSVTSVTFTGDGTVLSSTPSSAVTTSGTLTATLATQTANTVLGALTATTPSDLALPSCSTSASALKWTSGTGFGCNTAIAASTVTTNANLTGVITSSGNATSIASQTGTGTKFVVDTSPTLVTPNIGAATGTSLAASGVMSTGANSGTNGQITFNGSTSGSVTLKAAAAAGTGTNFTLPATNGTNTYVLQTDGSGNTSWVAASTGSGTVTSVTFTGDGTVLSSTPSSAVTTSGTLTATLATQTANTVLGALTATTPSDLALPSCSTSASALKWTSGTGFGCNTAIAASTVTTNANLTGVITSSGNATSIASQTGTGTKFVVDTSPTLVTPNIGAATGTSLAASGAVTDTQSIGVTSTNGLVLTNTTAAALGAQQWSPRLHFDGRGWETNTSASQAVDMIEELQPVQGAANPSGNLTWSSSINGGAYGALMTLTTAGSVGIGTTSPEAPLQVGAASTSSRLYISGAAFAAGNLSTGRPTIDDAQIVLGRTATAQSGGIEFNFSPAGGGYGWKLASPNFSSGSDNGSLLFLERNNSATWSEYMRISNSGNVGIGTTSPASELDVYGNVAIGTSYAGVTAAPTNGMIVQGSVAVGTSSATPGEFTLQNASAHAGQAACWTTGGAAGYCTTVVGATGACTCTGL